MTSIPVSQSHAKGAVEIVARPERTAHCRQESDDVTVHCVQVIESQRPEFEHPTADAAARTARAQCDGAIATDAWTWIRSVIGMLDVATQQLDQSREAAQSAIGQAISLLQEQMPRSKAGAHAAGGLLPWQVRKVREYVDTHIAGRVLVSDLSALVQLSEAHFSRSFKRAFGVSPYAFVVRRRLELAARLMLESSDSLTDIALRCGFADQPHLCNQFRHAMGESPAAWRRARRGEPIAA
jgi:AraC family transcriptional regulator